MNEKLKYLKDNIKILMSDLKSKERRKKQIPNLLTLSRLLSPLVIIPLALTGNLLLVGISVGIFSLTDLFDGMLARKYNTTSEFGRLLDACTDKVFVFSLVFPLIFTNKLLLVNLILEFIISFINVKSNIKNNNPKTILLGKIKTTFLFLLVSLSYIANLVNVNTIINAIFLSTTILQTGCILKYQSIDSKKEQTKVIIEKQKNNISNKIENNKIKELEKEKKKYQELKEYVINCKENDFVNQKDKIKVLKK